MPNDLFNQQVDTPNGPGIVQGPMHDQGYHYLVVRHNLAEMRSKDAGKCLTPRAQHSGLWMYLETEIVVPGGKNGQTEKIRIR